MNKKIISAILAISLLFTSAVNITVNGETLEQNKIVEISAVKSENSYSNYLVAQSDNLANIDVFIDNALTLGLVDTEIKSYTDSNGNTADNAVIISEETGSVTYNLNVVQAGLYNIKIEYCALEQNGADLSFKLEIDSLLPFDECDNISLPRLWKNEKEIQTDLNVSEYSPRQIEANIFNNIKLCDYSGMEDSPYLFYFETGYHTITISGLTEALVVSKIALTAPDKVKSYADVKSEYKTKGYESISGKDIIIEGEKADLKTSRAISPKTDNTTAKITPSSSTHQLLNYIGGSNWKGVGEEVTWKFNVEESGLYKIGTLYKQDQNINMYSYRQIKIDGKVPFEECNNIKFQYGTDWNTVILGNGEEVYEFWLEKGEHTLSMTSTLGDTAAYFGMLQEQVAQIGNVYLEVAMITGESPDQNRDYDLFVQIPDLEERLNAIHTELGKISSDMKKQNENESNSLISAINNMMRVIKSMVDNPYTAQRFISDYYTNYTTVSSWLYDMKSMPLSIDQIRVIPSNETGDFKKTTWFERTLFSIKRFIFSFTSEYAKLSSTVVDDAPTLKIWVNWGRDQTMVLNNLIQEDFVAENGINVNLEITNATLVNGMLSGNAPDLSLHLARTEPVNLAMRGALYDLTEFDDYNQVIERFGESSSIPYKYKDGVYALPDTQSFYIMFYRSDILKSLGLEVPETWEEFLTAVSVLQRNNMNAWLPYTQITAASTVNTGVGGLNLFASILQQFNGSIYDETLTKTSFENDNTLKAFDFWTDMYTEYKLPTTANFYNRFRTGTMPLGIEVYTTYTTLKEAAPEIEGKWGIALVPGIAKEDGTVDHTVAGSGTGCVILKSSKEKEAAWKFLKWWTSDDTQLMYNNNVESIIGTVSRVTTANVGAFERMSWKRQDLAILLEQRENIKEIPEIPGSYYVSRSVDQSFWNVVNDHKVSKDTLQKWGKIADNEIKRKMAEYSDSEAK